MTDREVRPSLAAGGASERTVIVTIVIAAVVAILMFSLYDRPSGDSGTRGALVERGMSPGHRLLNRETGRTLPANSPRIQRADALITRVAARFRTSKDEASELALTTRNMIAEERPEDVLDVLDATLFATEGLAQGQVPALAPVLAAYAKARMGGGDVATARNITRSFVQTVVGESAPR